MSENKDTGVHPMGEGWKTVYVKAKPEGGSLENYTATIDNPSRTVTVTYAPWVAEEFVRAACRKVGFE